MCSASLIPMVLRHGYSPSTQSHPQRNVKLDGINYQKVYSRRTSHLTHSIYSVASMALHHLRLPLMRIRWRIGLSLIAMHVVPSLSQWRLSFTYRYPLFGQRKICENNFAVHLCYIIRCLPCIVLCLSSGSHHSKVFYLHADPMASASHHRVVLHMCCLFLLG